MEVTTMTTTTVITAQNKKYILILNLEDCFAEIGSDIDNENDIDNGDAEQDQQECIEHTIFINI